MGNSDRNTAADLDSGTKELACYPLPSRVQDYNFYQLVELVHRLKCLSPEDEEWERTCRLVFSANSSLGFAASDVQEIKCSGDKQHIISTNFFGLSGAHSPLPGFIVEQLVNENEPGLKQPFLDFFNNRLISLLYRIWRKYRYYVRFSNDAQDSVSALMFALVGLSDPHLRGETPINWCKMLAYSGTLAGRNRSPQFVAGIISHCFELPDVKIRQWVRRNITINREQRTFLNVQNFQLGSNMLVGERLADCSGKFVISINRLCRKRFLDFLPSGSDYPALCKLVELIMREQMAYDLELILDEKDSYQTRLSKHEGTTLGWTSFLGCSLSQKKVLIQVRQ